MEETEKQQRDKALLKTLEDYKNIRQVCVEMSNGCTHHLRDAIKDIEIAVKEYVDYVLSISRPYRKKQRFWSRLKDKRLEKRQLEDNIEEAAEELDSSEPEKEGLWSRFKTKMLGYNESEDIDLLKEKLTQQSLQIAALSQQLDLLTCQAPAEKPASSSDDVIEPEDDSDGEVLDF